MTTRSVYVRIRGDVSDLNRALIGGGRHVRDFTRELETGNDRATWLVQGVSALLPALSPLAVQGVPILAGLSAQLGFAAGAAGTAVAAFWGMGDAMKAINTYQADPTVANLEKVQEALDKLGPAGRDFVTQLDQMMPRLRELKIAAENGLLPGAAEGLDELMTVLPRVRDIVDSLASASGQNLADLGESLADDRMIEFFDYLERNAGPITRQTGVGLGLLAEGLGDLMIAFEPVQQGWSEGFVDMARRFRDWADGLDDSDSLEEFLDYLDETGPQVLDTLGALGNMLLEVGEAAAPLGGPTLAILRAFADTISAIADSPIGPVLIGATSAVFALSRALAVSELLFKRNEGAAASSLDKITDGYRGQVSAIKDLPASFREVRSARQQLLDTERQAQKTTGAYLGQLQANNQAQARGATTSAAAQARLADSLGKVELANRDVAAATERARAAEASRSTTLRQSAVGLGKSAAAGAGLALAVSGAADGMGLGNTASLALAGTLAGPWGAAVGGAIGLVMDFNAASEDLERALSSVQRQIGANVTAMEENRAAILAARGEVNELVAESLNVDLGDLFNNPLGVAKERFSRLLDIESPAQRTTAALDRLGESQRRVETTAYALGTAIDGQSRQGLERFNQVVGATRPAMDALGISWEELSTMDGPDAREAFGDIIGFMERADSYAGRVDAIGDAITGLEDPLLDTATSAQALGTALEAALAPRLNAEAATDQLAQTTRSLSEALSQNRAGFEGQGKAVEANRAATAAWAGSLQQALTRQAEAGASSQEVARNLQLARAAFIREGVAAGYSADKLRRRLRVMGLTPKLVKTVFEAAGVEQVSGRVARLNKAYQRLPRRIRSVIKAEGVPKTAADIDRLDRKVGGLTKRERRVIARLKDETPATQEKILRNLKKVDKADPRPTAQLKDEISSKIPGIQSRINSLQGKTVYMTTVERRVKENAAGGFYDTDLPGISNAGDRRDAHQAQVVRTMRVFGEPETRGESYIPHANDWRRPGAKRVMEQTAAVLGGEVTWHAAGAFIGNPDTSARGRGVDYATTPALAGLSVTGVLDTPWGPAAIQGMIDDSIGEALASENEMADMVDRASVAYGATP